VLGAYKNWGKEWYKKRESPAVADHDFIPPDVPRAYPYGIYDLKTNTGFVNVGTDHDTSGFAVASIRAWWESAPDRLSNDGRFDKKYQNPDRSECPMSLESLSAKRNEVVPRHDCNCG
jgi:hypothetical protein